MTIAFVEHTTDIQVKISLCQMLKNWHKIWSNQPLNAAAKLQKRSLAETLNFDDQNRTCFQLKRTFFHGLCRATEYIPPSTAVVEFWTYSSSPGVKNDNEIWTVPAEFDSWNQYSKFVRGVGSAFRLKDTSPFGSPKWKDLAVAGTVFHVQRTFFRWTANFRHVNSVITAYSAR